MSDLRDDHAYLRPNQPHVCGVFGNPETSPPPEHDPTEICGICDLRNPDRVVVRPELDRHVDSQTSIEEVEGQASGQGRGGTDVRCKTFPNVRRQRRQFAIACAVLTVGFLIVSFSIPQRNNFIAPGPLSSHHAKILDGHGADRCGQCHAAGSQSFLTWIADTISGGQTIPQPQSELCLKCHQDMMSTPAAMLAHNLTSSQIQALSAKYRDHDASTSRSSAMQTSSPVGHAGKPVACATCHKEHHGANHNLSLLTDQQCQTCHQKSFASFESDHPEFHQYPQQRRSRIAFDHSTHMGKHFASRNQEFRCDRCHVDDSFQNVKLLAPFEQSCADCHERTITDSVSDGVELLSLPVIDPAVMENHDAAIGQWPQGCCGDFDGKLPELTRLFLSCDPLAADALRTLSDQLGKDFDLIDIDPEDRSQVQALSKLIWSVKRLMLELSRKDRGALLNRLADTNASAGQRESAREWLEHFDPAAARRAVLNWLPDLESEIKAMDDVKARNATRLPAKIAKFSRDLNDEVLADNPLTPLMRPKSLNDRPDSPQDPMANSDRPVQDESPQSSKPSPSREIHRKSNRPIPGKMENEFFPKKKSADVDRAIDEKQLAENPLKALAQKNPLIDPLQQKSDKKRQPVEQPDAENSGDATAVNDEPEISDVKNDAKPAFPPADQLLDLIDRSNPDDSGDWYENPKSFSIRYRPTGHADPFLKSLADYLVSREAKGNQGDFESLLKPTAVGNCSSCHTIDHDQGEQSTVVNWQAKFRDPSIRKWTNFSHRPHLIGAQTSDCQSCHKMDTVNSIVDTFAGRDPHVGRGNFLPMRKSDCISCHQNGRASNRCTTCHSYHIGTKIGIGRKK